MELNLAPNPLHQHVQTLTIDKVATLIGENGSGKSSILQSIFENGLQDNHDRPFRTICFSSGQNESFSKSFDKYVKKIRKQGRTMGLASFYFDKSWSKLVIFLATALEREGKTRTFLIDRGYSIESNDINQDDLSSKLSFQFKVDKRYTLRVQDALKREEIGEKGTLRQTPFHRSLESFIEEVVDPNFNFENRLDAIKIELSTSDLLAVKFAKFDPEVSLNEQDFGDDPSISFFTQAVNVGFVNKWSFQLHFDRGLELDDLSDGEYQLLFLYALIDLFDSENTLFLFDEADSHLHYKNVEKLWALLHSIKGQAITTTHLLDSISAKENRIEHLKVVEKGKISEDNKIKQLINRLSVLARAKSVEFEVCGKLPNVAILDDENDWAIFVKLAARKGHDVTRLSSISPLKKSSSYTSDEDKLGEVKVNWVKALGSSESQIFTKKIFLICDRDEANPNWKPNGVQLAGRTYGELVSSIKWAKGYRVDTFLLAWKRREIKHYLLSYTALSYHNRINTVNNKFLAAGLHLKPHDSGDNDGIRKLSSDTVKAATHNLINNLTDEEHEKGLCMERLQAYIDLIPPKEISEDITKMYNFIIGKL